MSIWRTSIPTTQDYPIWAFTEDDSNDVVLIRYPDDFEQPITWCKAEIPPSPKSRVRREYEIISDRVRGECWSSYDWFRAGYSYGTQVKGTCECDKGQAIKPAQSPFVNPETYWEEEPNESAYDERL
jgi:hypothetical protein